MIQDNNFKKIGMMQYNKQILIWLALSGFMVVVMVFVGGWTRLADAGLSIVEWKPVTGILPPLFDADWEIEFSKYRSSPEFQKLHSHFELGDFKKIFWLEFIHRILGRITGIVILLPALFFWYRGNLRKISPYISMILLVAFQGFIGWWMVKSGLVDNPHVSHFRLGFHLVTALILYSVIFWEVLVISGVSGGVSTGDIRTHSQLVLLLVFIQIFLGALVAGLDAGMIYNTFPLMGSKFVPSEFELSWQMLYDPASVQFLHRCMAYVTAVAVLWLAYRIRDIASNASVMLVFTISGQILLGILTIIYIVPVKLALAHQLFAVLLLSSVLYVLYLTRRKL